jgi:hypothetical protein
VDQRRIWRAIARRTTAVAAALVVMVIVGVGARAALDGWTPWDDGAFVTLRAEDVFSHNPPLTGASSMASNLAGGAKSQTYHPGPLQFDLLAVPVALLGVGAGGALGTAVLNAAAVAGAGWLIRRRAGDLAGATTILAFASLAWACLL